MHKNARAHTHTHTYIYTHAHTTKVVHTVVESDVFRDEANGLTCTMNYTQKCAHTHTQTHTHTHTHTLTHTHTTQVVHEVLVSYVSGMRPMAVR